MAVYKLMEMENTHISVGEHQKIYFSLSKFQILSIIYYMIEYAEPVSLEKI